MFLILSHDGTIQFQNILCKSNNYYYYHGKLKKIFIVFKFPFVGDRM